MEFQRVSTARSRKPSEAHIVVMSDVAEGLRRLAEVVITVEPTNVNDRYKCTVSDRIQKVPSKNLPQHRAASRNGNVRILRALKHHKLEHIEGKPTRCIGVRDIRYYRNRDGLIIVVVAVVVAGRVVRVIVRVVIIIHVGLVVVLVVIKGIDKTAGGVGIADALPIRNVGGIDERRFHRLDDGWLAGAVEIRIY
jgi:hypothetical protein